MTGNVFRRQLGLPFVLQCAIGLVVRYAKDQPLDSLDDRVRTRHFVVPVLMRQLKVVLGIHFEMITRTLAAEHVELAAVDAPGVRAATGAPRHRVVDAVGTKAAELRHVPLGRFGKLGLVGFAGEAIRHTEMLELDGRVALHCRVVGEVGHRVVAQQHQLVVGAVAHGAKRAIVGRRIVLCPCGTCQGQAQRSPHRTHDRSGHRRLLVL